MSTLTVHKHGRFILELAIKQVWQGRVSGWCKSCWDPVSVVQTRLVALYVTTSHTPWMFVKVHCRSESMPSRSTNRPFGGQWKGWSMIDSIYVLTWEHGGPHFAHCQTFLFRIATSALQWKKICLHVEQAPFEGWIFVVGCKPKAKICHLNVTKCRDMLPPGRTSILSPINAQMARDENF